eukprot:scaffold151728_cov28-Tisochrysis_lutea.AAC.4
MVVEFGRRQMGHPSLENLGQLGVAGGGVAAQHVYGLRLAIPEVLSERGWDLFKAELIIRRHAGVMNIRLVGRQVGDRHCICRLAHPIHDHDQTLVKGGRGDDRPRVCKAVVRLQAERDAPWQRRLKFIQPKVVIVGDNEGYVGRFGVCVGEDSGNRRAHTPPVALEPRKTLLWYDESLAPVEGEQRCTRIVRVLIETEDKGASKRNAVASPDRCSCHHPARQSGTKEQL